MGPTQDQARSAKEVIKRILNRPAWGRGVGLTLARDTWSPGSPSLNAVYVGVQRPEHIAIARRMLGDVFQGVPVVYSVVGDIVAQTGQTPAAAPPAAPSQYDGTFFTLLGVFFGIGLGAMAIERHARRNP